MTKKWAVLILVLLIPFAAGGLLGYTFGHSGGPVRVEQTIPSDGLPYEDAMQVSYQAGQRDSVTQTVAVSRQNAITRSVALASPAVVGINVLELRKYREWSPWGDDPLFRQFFGDRVYTQPVRGLGSGFIISPDGYIVTNDHVAGNAKEVTVTMTNGEKYDAKVVGTDQITDICLLKIDAKNLPYIRLGNSDDVIIGEWVIAMGNPFGLFEVNDKPTVTVGVVSATNMRLNDRDGRVYRGMIQTDAAINSGNSGGPLMNSIGEVIGINTAIFTPNEGNIGIGFAIPISRVKSIVAQLKRSGKIERELWTGLEIQPVDRRIARYFGMGRVEGVIVSDIKKGSSAEKSGLKLGDIILRANGEKVDDEATLIGIVEDAKPGSTVRLSVFREKKTIDVPLKLEGRGQ
jgi:serine protease Do